MKKFLETLKEILLKIFRINKITKQQTWRDILIDSDIIIKLGDEIPKESPLTVESDGKSYEIYKEIKYTKTIKCCIIETEFHGIDTQLNYKNIKQIIQAFLNYRIINIEIGGYTFKTLVTSFEMVNDNLYNVYFTIIEIVDEENDKKL